MAYTEEQLKAAARKALAAGDVAAAQRLIAAARAAAAPAKAQPATADASAEAKRLEAMRANIAAAKAGTLQVAMPERQRAIDAATAAGLARDAATAAAGRAKPGVAEDMLMSLGSGVVRGAAGMADLPGLVMSKGGGLIASGLEKVGLPADYAQEMRRTLEFTPLGSGHTARDAANLASGGFSEYAPGTTAGKYAGTVGEFLPGGLLGGGGVGGALQYGVVPGLASEAAGQATEGSSLEPYARFAAAMLAPLAVSGAQRVISPFGGADPARLKMAGTLKNDFGITPTAGQETGSRALRAVEGVSISGQNAMEAQADDFTRAVLRTAGIDADRASAAVLEKAYDDLGDGFKSIITGLDVAPTPGMKTAMGEAVSEYRVLAPRTTASPIFEEIYKTVSRAEAAGAQIPARTVSAWRSSLSKLTTSADPATREAAIRALSVVDDGINNALLAAGRPDDVARLATLRAQYRNLLAIERAAASAGEGARAGVLSPASVARAVSGQGRKAFVTGGRGDLGALASSAEGVLSALPTVAPNASRSISGGSAALGAVLGSQFGGAVGAGAGAAAPFVAREIAMLPFVQSWLRNQAISGGAPTVPGLLGTFSGANSR